MSIDIQITREVMQKVAEAGSEYVHYLYWRDIVVPFIWDLFWVVVSGLVIFKLIPRVLRDMKEKEEKVKAERLAQEREKDRPEEA